jgi:hypothetical protein
MVTLSRKSIEKDLTLGEILQTERVRLRLSIPDLEARTKIAQKYLKALETGKYDILPADVYVQNFLKVYAKLLSLDSEILYDLYQKEKSVFEKAQDVAEKHNKQMDIDAAHGLVSRIKALDFVVVPRLVKAVLVGLVIIIVLGYLSIELRRIFLPPSLDINAPMANAILQEGVVNVQGQAAKGAEVFINGKQVLLDRDGLFDEQVGLTDGINTLNIRAVNQHGQETVEQRSVFVEVKN